MNFSMNSKSYVINLIYIISVLATIFIILLINSTFRVDSLYGSPIFLVQLKPLYIVISLILFIIIFFLAEAAFNKACITFKHYTRAQKFVIIALASFSFKLLLLNFNLGSDDVTPTLNDVFIDGKFNQYKLYSFLALLVSKITSDYNFYLTLINIILGSLSISILYLIFSTFPKTNTRHFLTVILTLAFVPLNVIEVLVRVDTLFLFLFLLSIYFLIKQIKANSPKNILFLNLVLFFSCLCRESTIYILPLFILISLFASRNKFQSVGSITITVLLTTSFLVSFNEENYGMKSRIKEYHLIYHMMHYGYLNENIIAGYKEKLSPDAQSLLEDIRVSYENNVPPHKRRNYDDSHLGGALRSIWYLVRPDYENVVIKSTMTPYIGDFKKVKNILKNSIKDSPENIPLTTLDKTLTEAYLKMEKNEDKELAKYFKSQLFHVFLFKDDKLDGWPKGTCYEMSNKKQTINLSDTTRFNRDCVLGKITNIGPSYMYSRSDNWSYKRAAIPFTWRFDKTKKIYEQHPKINHVEEIIMSVPVLYITQSVLTLFGMSGYVSIPSGLGQTAEIYSKGILPQIFLIYFQGLYILIMNFWYVFSFFAVISSIFIKSNRDTQIREFFIGIIPIYYGIFLVFSVHFEFARLMVPIVPFIIYNFLVTISVISDSIKTTLGFSVQKEKVKINN